MAELREELEKAKGAEEELAKARGAQEELARAKEELAKAKSAQEELSSLASSLPSLTSSLQTSRKEAAAAQKDVADYKSALANLNMEQQQVQETESALRAEVSRLKEEVKETRVKLKTALKPRAPSTPVQPTQAQIAFAEEGTPGSSAPYFSPTLTRSTVKQLPSEKLSEGSLGAAVNAALQSKEVGKLSATLTQVHDKLNEVLGMNTHLMSKMMEGSHNIQVVARIRPLKGEEEEEAGGPGGKPICVEPLSATEAGYFDAKGKGGGSWKRCVRASERCGRALRASVAGERCGRAGERASERSDAMRASDAGDAGERSELG